MPRMRHALRYDTPSTFWTKRSTEVKALRGPLLEVAARRRKMLQAFQTWLSSEIPLVACLVITSYLSDGTLEPNPGGAALILANRLGLVYSRLLQWCRLTLPKVFRLLSTRRVYGKIPIVSAKMIQRDLAKGSQIRTTMKSDTPFESQIPNRLYPSMSV